MVRHKLEHPHGQKRQQVHILIGNSDKLMDETFSEFINIEFKNQYDLKFSYSKFGSEILDIVNKEPVDIFIIVINNLYFGIGDIDESLEMSLQLITRIKMTYGKPVIALSGWRNNKSAIARAKFISDFFFFSPCDLVTLGDAIAKCLEKLPAK